MTALGKRLGTIAAALAVTATASAQVCPSGWDCSCTVATPYVPSGAAWGTLNNPSFENGSTGGVANDWIAVHQTFSETPTYLVTTERTTHGSYSQKITIPSITVGQGYNNQRAGVYQQIYVVPGQTYTISVSVYMEFDGSESYPGQDMVAYVGIDPYGDTGIGAGSVTWQPHEGEGNKESWQTIQVQAAAIFEVMTVYACGMHKWEGQGAGRIWIDNFSITGPVPTNPPSPPESDWVDPVTYMPETVGGELTDNGSFETGWSSGMAGSWTAWSTSGSGNWRQSTRIGPIGGGKYDFSSSDTIRDMNTRVALTAVAGDADYWGTQPNMADTVIVGRLIISDQEGEISDPYNNGRAFAELCKFEADYHPRIDAWCGLNEPDWSEPGWTNSILWEKYFTERAHELGMKTVVLNMSTGSPGNIWKMLDAQELMTIADYVGYHPYGGPTDQLMINASPALNDPCSYALRWRKYVDMYRDRGWQMAPAIYTEGTTYGGWHGSISSGDIRDDLIAYGPFLLEDRWAVGIAIFCAGCGGTWEDWDIQGYSDIISAVGTWNMDHPTEATEGLYSQQFGAGNIHPTTTAEANNPDGDLTGGILQQITGLTPGEDYLIDLDFRYEFRGLQPQVTFETGVDTTGQTSNPNAGTISWSGDLIAAENVPHDTWERTWRTFTATDTTASIWLKAHHTVTNPAFRISIDRVSVRQAYVNQPPTAVAGASPTSGIQPLTVNFDGTGSTDPESDPLTYDWDFDDGSANGSGATTSHTFTTADTYNVTLTVDDGHGNIDTDIVIITVSEPPPNIWRSTSSISASCLYGTNAGGDSFSVRNGGGGTINYTITEDMTWLSCSPTSGSSNGETDTITITYATSTQAVGVHTGTITISAPEADNDPQTIDVTLTVSAPPSCTNNGIVNGGFESGLSPWLTFGNTDGVVDSGFYSITPHGGTRMFGAGNGGDIEDGGGYQQIDVCNGADMEVTVWIYTKEIGGADWDVNGRIGIDPTGGTDSSSANIVWTNWEYSPDTWSQIGLTGANSVTAQSETVTVFLEHWHKWTLSQNITLFDDVAFTATGGLFEDCTNGSDDDADGLTDCCDPDCTGYPACLSESVCDDGIDDDCDGDTDCDDSDCAICNEPTAVCESITRQLGTGGTLTVLADEITGNSTPGGDCCTLALSIRRPGLGYDDSVSFDANDIATSPNEVYAMITQSDNQIVYCTGDVTVEPAPGAKPVLAAAVSRKTHTGAGDWDIDVGIGDIESRSNQLGTANPNELKIIADFDPAVTPEIDLLGGSDVTTDNGTVNLVTKIGPTTLEIDVTGLADVSPYSTFNTQVNLAFPGVICLGDPASTSDSTLCVRVIVGDYDNLGRTNFTDLAKIKNAGYINQLVNSLDKARADSDCGGRPNFTDFAKVKNAGLVNQTAPACPVPPIGP